MGVGLVRSLQHPDILWIYWRVYNFIANTNKRVLFLPSSDAYVRSFLYLLYTLIKLYYTKALSDQASSLAPDWILLLRGPRIPALWFDNNLSLWERVWGKEKKGEWGTMTWRHSSFSYCISWSKYKSRLSFWLLQLDITNSSFSSSNIGTPNSEKDALTSQSSHQYHIELMKRFSSILGWHFFSPQFFTRT